MINKEYTNFKKMYDIFSVQKISTGGGGPYIPSEIGKMWQLSLGSIRQFPVVICMKCKTTI